SLLAIVAGAGVICAGMGARAEEQDQPQKEPPMVVRPPPNTPVIVEPAPCEVTPPAVAPQETPPPTTEYVEPAPAPTPEYQPPPERHRRAWRVFAPAQTALVVGGGVADYSGHLMRNTTEPGAQWDARMTFGTRSILAFEVGYAGTYNKFEGA